MLAATSPLTKIIPGLMIWTIVFFLITFFVLKRYAFGPIQKVIDDRRERAKDETEADRQRRLEETKRLIEAETQRALEQIRTEVADLTLIATERITGKVLDEQDHKRLIEEAVEGLDFSVLDESARR